VFRPVRGDEGFIVEGQTGNAPWRMEWGPSQRPYVSGNELRLRTELPGRGHDVQALVLDRTLQSSMESAVFDQYVDGVQTRIDTETPPEMRWLVMHPKLAAAELGPLAAGQPLVLMLARGRLTLRTALVEPDPRALDAWLRLFGVATREARRAGDRAPSTRADGPSSSLWATSQTDDADRR
jgi:hypothetical protein